MRGDKHFNVDLDKDPNFVNGEVTILSPKKQNSKSKKIIKNQKIAKENRYEKKVYIESYGCQMNFSDSEIVASILSEQGFINTDEISSADLVLINTCSIRDKAEKTVRNRLHHFNSFKEKNKNLKIGVMGCMAERLKEKLLEEEKIVDLVVGPDAYKDFPKLLEEIEKDREAINVILSKEETYGDINPVRINSNGVGAFVSIMRGCDNMCTFCVVPYTRGRERSRDPKSILKEINQLSKESYKEVTLLGQNVDSYLWFGGGPKKDFKKASLLQKKTAVNFSKLLSLVAGEYPKMRIRFSTSNPQDMSIDVIKTMSKYENICNHIHLPVQSGSNSILEKMNRKHTREEYIELIDKIKKIIPNCGISHDMIAGFPDENEKDHKDTLSLMEYIKYDFGFMFSYSERPGTPAAKKMKDNIPEEIKKRRLQEIIDLQQLHSKYRLNLMIGKKVCVLIEKSSKRSDEFWSGRTSQNNVVVFPKENYSVGDFVDVVIKEATSATLKGNAVAISSNI
ncbi:MAG: tRNA (N6-isopentenyl adenosine(37)-C2)-methylthiotransferase MiaB [Flavobacteriaceae bacterium]|nr:tRNA (N6-isopentenyl adenosine(37)-C2)-methylthiotransferase MiaB [Flavobacteriaceae bacterium]|tara:strand:- start:39469 stop:40995 length:1527 start_codon:yes stop_codon:yes gene_type:complete